MERRFIVYLKNKNPRGLNIKAMFYLLFAMTMVGIMSHLMMAEATIVEPIK